MMTRVPIERVREWWAHLKAFLLGMLSAWEETR